MVADIVMAVVDVAVEHNNGRQTHTTLKVLHPSTIVVAEHVPEVDRLEVSELLAKIVSLMVMVVSELFTVDVAVIHNKDRPTHTIV